MEKILTITVPSYNVEKYLEKTLDSFVEESVLDMIEVLIVDDGSKDQTAVIGKQFEEKYPGSFRVISKENGGHGSTINRGIKEAKGKYFKVVDGDDWVDTKDFAKLVQGLATCDADYVVANYYEVDDVTGEKTPKTFDALETEQDMTFEQAAEKVQIPMHALAIKTSILKEHNIRLDEHCFYVDVEYILFPVPYVQTVRYFDLYVYMYRLALQTQSVSMQGYQKHIQNHMDVIMHLTSFAEEYRNNTGITKQVKTDYIGKRIAQMVGDQISIFISYPADDEENKKRFMEFDRALKEKSPWIYELSGRESGLLCTLRKLNFHGYKMLMENAKKRHGLD